MRRISLDELIEIAKEIRKSREEGKSLFLSEEELAFFDLLSSKEKVFENYEEIKTVARNIVPYPPVYPPHPL